MNMKELEKKSTDWDRRKTEGGRGWRKKKGCGKRGDEKGAKRKLERK